MGGWEQSERQALIHWRNLTDPFGPHEVWQMAAWATWGPGGARTLEFPGDRDSTAEPHFPEGMPGSACLLIQAVASVLILLAWAGLPGLGV